MWIGVAAGLLGISLVALIDWGTGTEISVSVLYLLPVGLATWFAGRSPGLLIALLAAIAWLALDLRRGVAYSNPLIPYWNGLVRLGFFVLTAYLLDRVRFLHDNLEAAVRQRTAALEDEIAGHKRTAMQLTMLAQAVASTTELICITDLEDRFTFVNQAFQRACGYTEAEILGKTPAILYSPRNPPTLMTEILAQTRKGGWQGEVLDRRKDGSEFPIFLSTSPVRNESGEIIGLIGVSRDITTQKQAQATLRELAAIVENADDAILSGTLDGTVASWNDGAERLYGYTAAEMKGRSVLPLVPRERRDEFTAIVERVRRGERTQNVETIRQRKDGTLVEVSLSVSPIRDGAGGISGASIIARDVTPRKRLEREIAEISRKEQEKLARELHDHLGAYLAGVAFRAKVLAETLAHRALPEANDAQELVDLVNRGVDQTRNLALMLAPVESDGSGLAPALARLAAEFESVFGITCTVGSAMDFPGLTAEQSRELYRIAQEATRNAVQHAGAQLVEISVSATHYGLELRVRNDGKPWTDPEHNHRGMGVRIMQYRAAGLGGTLAIGPGPDGRTNVVCVIPRADGAFPRMPPGAGTFPPSR